MEEIIKSARRRLDSEKGGKREREHSGEEKSITQSLLSNVGQRRKDGVLEKKCTQYYQRRERKDSALVLSYRGGKEGRTG